MMESISADGGKPWYHNSSSHSWRGRSAAELSPWRGSCVVGTPAVVANEANEHNLSRGHLFQQRRLTIGGSAMT
jgi:hypothetical protein